jgi:hypothetical protein
MECIVPPPGAIPDVVLKVVSGMDIQMLSVLNAKERTLEDWSTLCKLTDDRLVVNKVTQVPGISLSIIDIRLNQ